jgi:hypothetical protein
MAKGRKSACGPRNNFCSNKRFFRELNGSGNITPPWPPIETGYEYVAEYKNLAHSMTERDGNVIFETAGKIRCIGGWNPAKPGTGWGAYDSTNQQWETSDGGVNWTQIANAPWNPRHNFAHGFTSDGRFWIWGGDGIFGNQTDVWTYDSVNGWVQITADWGLVAGTRISHSFCIHDDYLYLIGGSILDCVRSNDGITWEKMSDLPAALVTANYSNGYACSHRGYIYVLGGDSGGQLKVFRTATGATWEQLPDLAAEFNITTYWCRLFSWADRLWYFAGTGSSGNQRGIWMSDDDGQTWNKHYSFFMLPTHAQGVNTFGSDLYQIAGNSSRSSNRIYRVAYSALANKMVHSVRKAVAGYTGSAMRVRRSSDNAEQDIGFSGISGNDLDISTLAIFVGAGTGYVTKWYDQSGNGIDLVQTTGAWQPLIRSGGTTYTQNGWPAIYFDTSSKYMTYTTAKDLGSRYTISGVMNMNAGAIRRLGYTSNNYYLFYSDGSSTYHASASGGTDKFLKYASGWNPTRGSQKLIEVYRHRNTGWFYENGVKTSMDGAFAASIANTLTQFDTSTDIIQIGGEQGASSFIGYIQELNIKTGVVESDSNVAIQSDINGYFNIYV